MKIRHSGRAGEEKIELQMTPMIDIVFQLLIFFIMTFKIVQLEGDFNIKMPLAAASDVAPPVSIPPLKVRLRAGDDGSLAGISLGERALNSFTDLRAQVMAIVGPATAPGSAAAEAEVELDCDYGLHYEHVIEAITAVSGYYSGGEVIPLIQNIKFAPPRTEQDAEAG